MAETVGLLIFAGIGALGAPVGAGAAAFTIGATGISLGAVVGTAAILGVSVGLSYALRPDVPRPEGAGGSTAIQASVQARQRGYWVNRLAGAVMLFQTNGAADAQQVQAFHQGRVERIDHIYLDDIEISTISDISNGGLSAVSPPGGDTYTFVSLDIKMGLESQTASALLGSPNFKGNGIAYLVMLATRPATAEEFSTMYPRGLPKPSVVAKCSPIWDPRDPGQDENDPDTWLASPNPVLQLIDYLTKEDGGMGLPRTEILPTERLAEWMIEADWCDPGRYQSAGWYYFDNKPEDVINKILASCDGWMSEAGDGTLSLTVGVYREPTDPPLTENHIIFFRIDHGAADENLINQLDVSYTDPTRAYVTSTIDPIQDAESIAASGVVRAKRLDLSWVQSEEQAGRLGERALLRLNPAKSGTLTTTLSGLRYLGKRWVKVQYPFVNGLEDCVIEIQDRVEFDLLGGTVTFPFSVVDTVALAAI